MNKIITSIVLVFSLSFLHSQAKLNMELQSNITYGDKDGSGCWGHTDQNGIEYAIIGVLDGIRIYSLEDPKNPIERIFIPGVENRWREIRTWGDYIYVTTEGPDGVTIIDASQAPATFNWKRWFPVIPGGATLETHHSINLDTLGYLYINGSNIQPRGVLLFNLNNDPNNPEFVANIGNVYTHDCYANAEYLYTCDLGNGVAIYDIKDKTNPVFINRFQTSSSFTHNAWTSNDGQYLYTTDERSGAYVDVYDVSDPTAVRFINKYRNKDSALGKVIPHNTYMVGNWAVTSWYTDGILIKDMTRPDNIVKVGEYDTFYDEASIQNVGTWFYGCWGVYPFFKSGTIIGSDINSGLWVLKPEYKRASYLEGNVLIKKSETEFVGVPNATVKIINDRVAEDDSDQNGVYKTGLYGNGTYKAYVIHPDLVFDTAYVTLTEGVVTNHDFIIAAQTIRGQVFNNSGEPIPFSSIAVSRNNVQSEISTLSDVNGQFEVPVFRADSNELFVAAWGYQGKKVSVENISDELIIILDYGYQDDFFADLGWTNTRKAGTGNWERAVPIGTILENQVANCNEDVDGDIGNYAYVTGNGGLNVSENDIDNGLTRLESPIMDFSKSDSANISFAYWFVNGGGNNTPNDYIKMYLSNGIGTFTLLNETNSQSGWRYVDLNITNANIEFNSSMKFIIDIEDTNPGHIVEGGFDHFNVILNEKSVAVKDVNKQSNWSVNPSVTNDIIYLKGNINNNILDIRDALGQVIRSNKIYNDSVSINISDLDAGIYFLTMRDSSFKTLKIVKI